MRKPLKFKENEPEEEIRSVFRSRGTYYLISPMDVPGVYRLFRSRGEMASHFGVRYQSVEFVQVNALLFRYRNYDVWKLRFESKEGRIRGNSVYVLFEMTGGKKVTLHRNIRNMAEYKGCNVESARRCLSKQDKHFFRDKDFVIRFRLL